MYEIGLTEEERRVLVDTVERALAELQGHHEMGDVDRRRQQILARVRDALLQSDTTASAP